jgi:predicted nucleotidyltransferase
MVITTAKQQNLDELKNQLLPILRKHQVARAGIFGSTANGTAKITSDIDILIEFSGEKSLFELIALKLDLEEETKRKIDISTYKALNHLIRDSILAEEVKLL